MLPARFTCWTVLLLIIGACTCGGRTECSGRAQISLLTSVHDDVACRKISPRGVLLYEAAKLLADAHNNKTNGLKIELAVLDTCGGITGTLKAAMKALVWADMNCLQPPHYLGIIGPDNAANVEAVQKVTSILKVPHIVRKAANSPYLHVLNKESESYIVQGIMSVVETLKWKSFTLVSKSDEENADDVQRIAKKLTIGAIAKGLCVLIPEDDDDAADLTSHIIHLGKPHDDFFNGPTNATVIVVSEGRLEEHLNPVNSSNAILLLEDSRNEFGDLEARVEKSRWWTAGDAASGRFDAEELREVRWLNDAIEVYAKALDNLCKKKKCKNPVSLSDWNTVLSNVLTSVNGNAKSAAHSLTLSLKTKSSTLTDLGTIVIHKGKSTIHWNDADGDDGSDEAHSKSGGAKGDNDDDDDDDDDHAEGHDDDGNDSDDDDDDDDNEKDTLPDSFKALVAKGKDARTGCATTAKEIRQMHEDDDEEAARVLVSEMDDTEFWTMVGTVSGVGVAMFVVGILAVYIVYTNIRGPTTSKGKGRAIERDTSLRRVGSDRETPNTVSGRAQRPMRGQQRRDSNRSIRSNISDRSV